MGSAKQLATKVAFILVVLAAVKFVKGANIPMVSSTANSFL